MHRFMSFFFARIFPSFYRTSTVMPTFKRVWISVNGVLLTTNSNPLAWMSSSSVKRNFILLFAKDHTIGSRFHWIFVVVWDITIHPKADWSIEANGFAVIGWNVLWRKWWWKCWEGEMGMIITNRICANRYDRYHYEVKRTILTVFQFLDGDILFWQREKQFRVDHRPF